MHVTFDYTTHAQARPTLCVPHALTRARRRALLRAHKAALRATRAFWKSLLAGDVPQAGLEKSLADIEAARWGSRVICVCVGGGLLEEPRL